MNLRLLTLFAVFLVSTDSRAGLSAGAAVSDITPKEFPLGMRGSFSYRGAESAHDPLNARSIVLDDGETSLSMTVVDSCAVIREVLDKAKEKAAGETGIPTTNMLISATHTHSAPFADARNQSPQELAYQKLLIDGIARSIIQAHQNLKPAAAGWGGYDLPDEVFNRRWFLTPGTVPPDPFGNTSDIVKMNPGRGGGNLINPAGPIDPEVSVLSIVGEDQRPLALLANYSLHYVGGTPSGQLSADYFGEFARLMPVRLGGERPADDFVAMLSNGTSGDINNINFRNPRPPRERFEQIRLVAGKTADAAWRARKTIGAHDGTVKLGMIERELTLNLRQPSGEQIERARNILEIAGDEEKKLPKLAKAYAQRTLDLAEQGESVDIKIQALRIGDLAICSIPFEVFAEIGLELKAKSPFSDTFIIELANGEYGYLPTPSQHQLGGYETWLTTNKVQLNASQIIVENLLEMMKQLREENDNA